jgi:hypothetical protein
MGAPVHDTSLQDAHHKRSAALAAFIPAGQSAGQSISATQTAWSQPFEGPLYTVLVNGKDVGEDPVELRGKRNADMDLTLVRNGPEGVWSMDLKVSSEPKLRFFNKKNEKGLNSVPTELLVYRTQALLRPINNGYKIYVPIEISSIKQDDYVMHVAAISKEDKFEKDIKLHFDRH